MYCTYHKMIFKNLSTERINYINNAFKDLVREAENDGYVTTKAVYNKLKPDHISDEDLIISERCWWSCKEFEHGVSSYSVDSPMDNGKSIVFAFPPSHTGPYPNSPKLLKNVNLDDAKSHIDKYVQGMTDENNLAMAMWNILLVMSQEEINKMKKEKNHE